jgi:hypothetical protein
MDDVRVNVFELSGQLCLAVNTVHWHRPKLIFWVTVSWSCTETIKEASTTTAGIRATASI